tara:strand:- start:183 stop:956 length:774 start_codon:yes stop_codon:yes gene_type:complete
MGETSSSQAQYTQSSIRFGNISAKLIQFIKRILNESLQHDHKTLNLMSSKEYRALILSVQNKLNDFEVNKLIFSECLPYLRDWYPDLKGHLVQSNIYLRASRPIKKQSTEHIGWHRESFYGKGMEKAYNIWIPIQGVNSNNTLQFIPGSQDIPSHELSITSSTDPYTNRYSDGHKLGFLYSPKIINSGIDFNLASPLVVPDKSFACFPSELIHGSATNKSNVIRFSIDLRVIRKSDLELANTKDFHYASGKPYFVDL